MKWYSIPLRPAQLTLKHVLKSGQSFRWTVTSLPSDPALCPPPVAREEYSLCLKDRLVLLRQGETELHYAAVFPPTDAAGETREEGGQTTLAWIEDYFQLDVDLEGLYGTWGEKDEVFRRKFGSVEEGGEGLLEGIRVLRQDPWECLFSFICSSNNNIQRITGMVQSAARHFSPALLSYTPPLEPTTSSLPSSATVSSPPPDLPSLSHGPTTYHPFPPPSAFASPSVIPILRSLGFGYRAPFIQRTAEMLTTEHPDTPEPGTAEEDGEAGGEAGSAAERFLLGMREWETEKAREELLRYLGVGRKVADCVLLMSLDKKEVIPIDTHVFQIAHKLYSFKPSTAAVPVKKRASGEKIPMSPKLYEEVAENLGRRWGVYGGWTQAVLFASDLPFLLETVSSSEPKSFKPVKIRTLPTPAVSASTSTATSTSTFPDPIQPIRMPDHLLSPPPDDAAGAVKVEVKKEVLEETLLEVGGKGKGNGKGKKTTVVKKEKKIKVEGTRRSKRKSGALEEVKLEEEEVVVKEEVFGNDGTRESLADGVKRRKSGGD